MHARILLPALALSAASLVAAPAAAAAPVQDAPTTPAMRPAEGRTLPADLVALIPGDASVLVHVAAIDDLEAAAFDMVEILAPDFAPLVNTDTLMMELQRSGFDTDLIDTSRPLAMAVGAITPAIENEQPDVVFLVPSTAPTELEAALPFPPELGWTRVSGGYLGISVERAYPVIEGRSRLPERLPEGLVTATVDAAPMVDAFLPMVEGLAAMALEEMLTDMREDPEMPPGLKPLAEGAMRSVHDGLMDSLDALTGLDLAFDVQGARLESGYALTFEEGSPMAAFWNQDGTRMSDLLPLLDPGADLVMAWGMDLGGMARWARPYVNQILDEIPVPQTFPEGQDKGPFQTPRQAMTLIREALDHGMDAMTWMGDGLGASTYMGEDGDARTVLWMRNVQADNLSASLQALFEAELASLAGLTLEQRRLGDATLELSLGVDTGVLARNFRLSADDAAQARAGFDAAFPGGVRMSLTSVGDNTLVVMGGGPEVIKEALTAVKARGTSADLARLADELGDAYPFGAYRIDLGPTLGGMLAMAEAFDERGEIPPGLSSALQGVSLPLTAFEGATTTRWFQGVSLDLTQAAALAPLVMEAMMVRVEPSSPR